MRTGPGVDARGKDEEQLAQLPQFDPDDDSFVPFSASIDQESWQIVVRDAEFNIPLDQVPHVFPDGRVLLQTFKCRAVVRNISIEVLD
jgi:hypothetical protein